ncbi:MAG: hypothetical protein ACE5K7_08320 [Phycisphaerae bacterium]
MIRYRCDGCGKMMNANDPDRYIVKIEVFTAADVLQIEPEQLQRDHRAEIARLIEQLRQADADRIEDQVYRAFRFDLCAACHRLYLDAPLPRLGRARRRQR